MGSDGHVGVPILDYLLGALSASVEYEVEGHLLRCAPCRAEAAAMSEIAVALAMLPAETVADLLSAPTDPPGDDEPHETGPGPVI